MRPDDQKMVDMLKTRRMALASLVSSDGWKLMREVFAKAAQENYTRMVGTESAHESAKCVGAYHVCKDVALWPEDELARVDQTLRAILDQ